MAERQVTVDAERFGLAEAFFVIATQNPHEQHGTYPLPEAQLDRFAMKLEIGYPHRDDERAMLAAAVADAAGSHHDDGGPILEAGQLAAMQAAVAAIPVTEPVQEYLVTLAASTRNHRDIPLGVSPRGLLTWQRAAQAWAYLAGRQFVTPDDVQQVAVPVLSVRLGAERGDTESLIRQLLQGVEAPTWS
jgi:MoxR-like ATPase